MPYSPNASISGYLSYKDKKLIDGVHQLGKPVWTTISDAPKEEVRELIHLGINGIISDYPDAMEKFLIQKQ